MKDHEFIEKIIDLLIDKFGTTAVSNVISKKTKLNKPTPKERANNKRKKTYHRSALVTAKNKIYDSNEKENLILILAKCYDKKTFLPSIGSVKAFLDLHNYKGDKIPKNRLDAFRLVLQILIECSIADIKVIIRNDVSQGVSELGPLADAIRDQGDRLRNTLNKHKNSNE